MINLTELEAKARAAKVALDAYVSNSNIETDRVWQHAKYSLETACSPDVILELIAALKEAREMMKHAGGMLVIMNDDQLNQLTMRDVKEKARNWLAKYGGGE